MANLLEHYVFLKGLRRVKRDKLVGLCPLHKENTASFQVALSINAWICFGCQRHGNTLDFVMAREKVEVREAETMIRRWFPSA